ncbi:MAG: 1-deoxy-D-xylulose-5-phosphate synthase [Oscillospiraceae bacterium]|nr:1-deoxy-D-xylulose-5-phosphate synthase [Oscillospiraceae bacterium]
MILEHISTPADVKALSGEELKVLCGELRRSLVESVARTGGHLASNLGAVELTVALHRVYDTARDRLVFDVGHQCYVHKMLTGRRERFDTLRQLGGLSGFPKPEESGHDAFVAGHASNSVSVALGMARARTLRGEDYGVAALIGDGALTGGLAYEGLNDAGASGEPMVVILNDNGMSIDPNVGGVATHLSRLRLRPGYYRFKKSYRAVLEHLPGGGRLYRLNHRIKSGVKRAIYPCSMFEDMGFTYLGPVDGHNVEQLCTTLAWAREMACPVLLHVRTVKGKGYKPAEVQPERSHGVAPFDPAVGPDLGRSIDFSYVLGHELVEMAGKDRRLCAVTAAMAEGTGLQEFASAWPKRFFDVGIAEGHAVAMSAGLAKQGMVPVFAVYSSFLQRGFDMLLHDVALQGLHVVLAVDRAGLVGSDGPTHHGCQDVGYLTQIPGMTVLCPACFSELKEMLRWAVGADGPVAVRYPRGGEGRRYPEWTGEGASLLRQGTDVTLVSYGTMTDELLTAAELLAEQGVGAEVVKLHRVAPLDVEPVAESVRRTGRLLVLEDCNENGSIGQQLASALVQSGAAPRKMVLKNLKNAFAPQGTVAQLRKLLGLDAGSVAEAVREML